jgi:hypothetical protein
MKKVGWCQEQARRLLVQIDVAEVLPKVTKEWMKERYWKMFSDYQEEQSEDDFEYTWQNFEGLRQFFLNAAEANRAVIFTVEQ